MNLANSRVRGLKMEEMLSDGVGKEEYQGLKGGEGCKPSRAFVFWEGLRRGTFGEESKQRFWEEQGRDDGNEAAGRAGLLCGLY